MLKDNTSIQEERKVNKFSKNSQYYKVSRNT